MAENYTQRTEPKWSPSGNHICARWNKNLLIWAFDGITFTEEKPIETTNDLSDIAFSPNGKYLALGVWTSHVNLYNWNDRSLIVSHEGCAFAEWGNYAPKIRFSPDSTQVAFRLNKTVKIVNTSGVGQDKEIKFGESVASIAW
jgi:WD40 repeat protein